MNYRAIIQEAWVMTQGNKKLIWWFALVPALLSLLVDIVYLSYQAIAFWHSPYVRAEAAEESPSFILIARKGLGLFEASPSLGVFILIIIAIVALGYLFLPVFTQGSLIQLVSHMRKGQPLSVAKGISYGFARFLQLFEYHAFIKTFSFVGILTEASFAFRVFGPETFSFFGWIFLLVFILALFFTLLFTYSEYYIVLEKEGVFTSIFRSGGLVMRQWHHTLFMLLLMGIIIARMVLNIMIAMLIPVLIVAPIFIFTSLAVAKIGVVIGSLAALVILYFASYFFGVFHVFATAVWTFTFQDLTKEDAEE